ncbi:MAG: PQQ-binding-like beta-propeller repeat protein, partial [Bryobacterales bacterium]|nr:PQQ-binding-like beta-propeller repeat protein [Bryobacterales bacterium]
MRVVWPLLACSCFLLAQNHAEWRDYGGAIDSAQYSSLKQITRANVAQLKVAWRFATSDNQKYFFSPLVVGTTMYVLARNNTIVALNAATGQELWAHPPEPGTRI